MNKRQVVKRDRSQYVNLTRSEAQNHYRTESTKKEKGRYRAQKVSNKISDFFDKKFFTWFIHYFRSRFGCKHPFPTYESNAHNGIYDLKESRASGRDGVLIALAADWATDTKESDRIGSLISQNSPDYTIHLGDTYFVGMKGEVNNNFLSPDASWPRGSSGSFALLGNHEMYSRGISYFRDLLPTLGIYSESEKKFVGQKASYFCLQNDYWRIVCLDTGYNSVGIPLIEYFLKPDSRLRKEVLQWLKDVLRIGEDKRGIVLMTHHQYCSAFEEEYPKPAEQLASLIGTERDVLWIWGHEHRLSVYGKYKSGSGISAYGRCIGNGGMPVEFVKKMDPVRAEKSNLILYDERVNTVLEDVPIGYNGYALMNLFNENLSLRYFDINKKLLFSEKWKADNQSGKISGLEFELNEKGLNVFNDDVTKAVK